MARDVWQVSIGGVMLDPMSGTRLPSPTVATHPVTPASNRHVTIDRDVAADGEVR